MGNRTSENDVVRVGVYRRGYFSNPAVVDAFVASQPGWTIVRRFHDHTSSHTTNRLRLREVMRAAESGQIDLLVVDRMAELSIKGPDLMMLLRRLEAAGVNVRSVTEPFDTSTASGRLMLHMLEMFAEWEKDAQRREREAEKAFRGGDRG